MTPRLDAVGIVVADMARSLDFYRRLGIPIPSECDGDAHVEASLGSLRLLWDKREVISSFDPGWTAPSGGHTLGLAFACESSDEVDATYRSLVDAGFDGHLEPWDAVWGQRYATVHDPDGNSVDLFAPLPGDG